MSISLNNTDIQILANLQGDACLTNAELAKKLVNIYGLDEKDFITYTEDRPFNDCRYSIDSSKLVSLGWEPKVSFDEGLKRTSIIYT